MAAVTRCKEGSVGGSLAIAAEAYFMKAMRYDRMIDLTITPSRFAKSAMVGCGQREARIRPIPNFIDGTLYRPAYGNEGYIICFGRLSIEKGLDVLVEAAARLPAVRVLIAGEGPCGESLRRLALKLGAKNAEFLGYVARDKLLELVSKAIFVVIPSVWPENFPYSVLESFAVGKPVVASRIGGLPEMVEDLKTGFLVEPGDPADLTQKIAYLAGNPALAVEMGKAARARIDTEFDASTHYGSIKKVYNELIGS
jgi:glycosyltransferase involved in cell wall biosynthesis